MDLTTATRVKDRLDITGSGEDGLLGVLITSVSAHFERYTRRIALVGSQTEVLHRRRFNQLLPLRAVPASAVTSIKFETQPNDLSTASAMDTDDYWLSGTGYFVELIAKPTLDGFWEVQYTGGMAADTASFVTAYPDVADSVDLQVVHEWKRRQNPGSNVTSQGGSTTFSEPEIDLLKGVRRVWDSYKLVRVA